LAPAVDIYETGEGLLVIADLPGVAQDGVSVSADNDILTIQGTTCHVAKGEEIQTEYRLLDFYRQFSLGHEVDQERITADIKHGVLTVRLPKTERAKPKQVKVRVS
jgi:HSP20 family protein